MIVKSNMPAKKGNKKMGRRRRGGGRKGSISAASSEDNNDSDCVGSDCDEDEDGGKKKKDKKDNNSNNGDGNGSGGGGKRKKKSVKTLLVKALYPHGWKAFLIVFFALTFIAPGIPMFLVLLLTIISTFFDSFTAALFCPFLMFFQIIVTVAQYCFNLPFDAIVDFRERHKDILRDLSIPTIGSHYLGIFFTFSFFCLVVTAMFVRLQNVLLNLGPIPLADNNTNDYDSEYVDDDDDERKEDKKKRMMKKKKLQQRQKRRIGRGSSTSRSRSRSRSMTRNMSRNASRRASTTIPPLGFDGAAGALGAEKAMDEGTDGTVDGAIPVGSGGRGRRGIKAKFMERLKVMQAYVYYVRITISDNMERFWLFMKRLGLVLFINLLKYSYLISLLAVYFVCLRGTNVLNFIFMIFFLVFFSFPGLATDYWNALVRYSQFVLLIRYIWTIKWTPDPDKHQALRIIGLFKYADDSGLSGTLEMLSWEIVLVMFVTIQMFFLDMVHDTEANDEVTDKENEEDRDLLTPAQLAEIEARKQRRQRKKLGMRIPEEFCSSNSLKKLYSSLETQKKPAAVEFMGSFLRYAFRHGGVLLIVLVLILCGSLMAVSLISISFLVIAFVCINFYFHSERATLYLRRAWPFFLAWEILLLFSCYTYQFEELQSAIINAYEKCSISEYVTLEEWGLVSYGKNVRFIGLLPIALVFIFSTIQFSFLKDDSSNSNNNNNNGKSNNNTNNKSNVDDEDAIPKGILDAINCVGRFIFIYAPFVTYVFAVSIFLKKVTVVHFIFLVTVALSRLSPHGIDNVGVWILWGSELFCLLQLIFNLTLLDSTVTPNIKFFQWLGFSRNYVPAGPIHIHTENFSDLYVYIILSVFVCIERVSLRWGLREAEKIERGHEMPREIPLLRVFDDYEAKAKEDKSPFVSFVGFLLRLPNLLYYQVAIYFLCLCLFIRAKSLISVMYLAAVMVCITLPRFRYRRYIRAFMTAIALITLFQYLTTLGLPNVPKPPIDSSSEEVSPLPALSSSD